MNDPFIAYTSISTEMKNAKIVHNLTSDNDMICALEFHVDRLRVLLDVICSLSL